jgi:thiol-disulfide isomerase/thioredoxin
MSEDINQDPRRVTVPANYQFALFDPAGAQPVATTSVDASAEEAAVPLPIEGELPSLDGATEWLNSPPLTAADLRGKIVLIDFWTYTCINWLRTLPYIRAWSEKYRDQGLVVIGVHAPEFPFEHEIENVRRAAQNERVTYPIVVDNAFTIWRAFNNHYWPALYLLDAEGRIRHHHFGEGDYARSEIVIQRLLAEAGADDASAELVAIDGQGIEAEADWSDLESPESYLGAERSERFASPGGLAEGERRVYSPPGRLQLNHWALAGDWTVTPEAAMLNAALGRIAYAFHARDVHLVMAPPAQGAPVRFRVSIDGRPATAAHGADVDEQGNGTVREPRTYQLIRQSQPIDDRQFEIEFLDPGVEAFAFTFG